MMTDCAALMTHVAHWQAMETPRDRVEIEPPPAADFAARPAHRVEARQSGKFGNAPTRMGDCDRKARTIRTTQIVNPIRNHRSACVAKQRDDQAWFARTEIELQNSTCDVRSKRSKNLHRNAGWNS
jgi:hypothetical protein